MKFDLTILDGRHLLYRTSDAFRELQAEVDGETMATGGMYGFLNVSIKIHHAYGGKVVVAWEGDRNNFRLGVYPEYKNKHKPIEAEKADFISEMSMQERHLKGILVAMGVRQYLGVNCEADDVIGRLATEVSGHGKRVLIYSGDSDLRQLVREGSVWTASPGQKRSGDKVYGPAEVQEKHGVPPELLPDLKALAGDNSDNIPGARGIGPKTAAKLLSRYGSLSGVLEAAKESAGGPLPEGWPSTVTHRDTINACSGQLRMYLTLTRVKTDCDMDVIKPEKRQAEVVKLLQAYKFRSLAGPAELYQLMRMGG